MKTGIHGGMAELDAMIEKTRTLFDGDAFPQTAARAVDTWLRSKLEEGVDPNTDEKWAPTLKGKKPLKTAPERPIVRLAGRNIIISIRGYYVFQHFSTRGRTARRVIPQGRMPLELGNAIRNGQIETFHAKTKAGKRGWRALQLRRVQ